MRYLIIILMLVTSTSTIVNAEEVEMPRAVDKAIERFEKEKLRALQEYQAAIMKARADLVEKLEEEMNEATKDADLDLALAIRSKIRELDDQAMAEFTGEKELKPELVRKSDSKIDKIKQAIVDTRWHAVDPNPGGLDGFGIGHIFNADGSWSLAAVPEKNTSFTGSYGSGTWGIEEGCLVIRYHRASNVERVPLEDVLKGEFGAATIGRTFKAVGKRGDQR